MLNIERSGEIVMLPKKIRMVLTFGLVISSLLLAWRPAEATGPCGPPGSAGCLSSYLNYYTNQVISSGNCNASSLPSGVATTVAVATDYPFSSNSWNAGWTGEMVLTNPSSTTATTFKLATYAGGFVGIGSNQSLTILAGDTIVVPFTRIFPGINPSSNMVFEVTVTPAANLTCQTVSYYTWEHD
jgi:hypothetical protein